jgi:plasmid replication initiation protein
MQKQRHDRGRVRTKLVKVKDELIEVPLNRLNPVEMKLFWTLVREVCEQGTDEIALSRERVEELSGYSKLNRSIAVFRKDMKSMATNIASIPTSVELEDGTTAVFALFPLLEIDNEKVVIKVAQHFGHWLNKVFESGDKYVSFKLEKLVSLKSKYTIELFKYLMRFRENRQSEKYGKYGCWKISLEDFRVLLNIPKSYEYANINQRILKPAKEELTEVSNWEGEYILEFLKINTLTKKGTGGKPAVTDLEFIFKEKVRQPFSKPTTTKMVNGKPVSVDPEKRKKAAEKKLAQAQYELDTANQVLKNKQTEEN